MGGDLFEILFVVAFILFGILGGRKKKPGASQTGGTRPRPPMPGRTSSSGAPTARRPQTTQDALLRELEGLLTGRPPAEPPPWAPVPGHRVPDPTEARSLETLDADETATWEEGLRRGSEETATWEEGLERAAKVQETPSWLAGQRRPTASLETLQGAGEAEHDRFHERYDVRSRPPTSGARRPTFDMQDIRRAVVWSEILGTPVSMR